MKRKPLLDVVELLDEETNSPVDPRDFGGSVLFAMYGLWRAGETGQIPSDGLPDTFEDWMDKQRSSGGEWPSEIERLFGQVETAYGDWVSDTIKHRVDHGSGVSKRLSSLLGDPIVRGLLVSDEIRRIQDEIVLSIRTVLEDPCASWYAVKDAVNQINLASESDVASLIRIVLEDPQIRWYDREGVISQIHYASEADVASLIRTILEGPQADRRGMRIAISQIHHASESDVASLIRTVLENPHAEWWDKRSAISQIHYASEADQADLRSQASSLIRDVLENPHAEWWDKRSAISRIHYAREADQADLKSQASSLIRAVLENPHGEWWDIEIVIDQIHHASEEAQAGLWDIVDRLNLGGYLKGRSVLHDYARTDKVVQFNKTGSETFIGPRRTGSSVRLVEAQTVTPWLMAYAAMGRWRQAGFDYVPIEPILGIKYAGHGRMAVRTVNLRGGSLKRDVYSYNPPIQSEIFKLEQVILNQLEKLNIKHGHAHRGNFVLVPQLTKGKPDPTKVPRIYLIDFDRSKSG